MKRIQSRGINVALLGLGLALVLYGLAGFVEACWKEGPAGLVEPNAILWGVVFVGLGLWCGIGGWKNLRAASSPKVG